MPERPVARLGGLSTPTWWSGYDSRFQAKSTQGFLSIQDFWAKSIQTDLVPPTLEILAIPEGLEPPTNSLEGCCSIQLSYGTEALGRAPLAHFAAK
ncbi:MAG: hypothetical protein JWR51_4200 [Devosia sp.]|nr:hypothetical protein [Devosia sp.]